MDRAADGFPPPVGLRPSYEGKPSAILILIDARSGPDRRAADLIVAIHIDCRRPSGPRQHSFTGDDLDMVAQIFGTNPQMSYGRFG
jgi:hypothetical protein